MNEFRDSYDSDIHE